MARFLVSNVSDLARKDEIKVVFEIYGILKNVFIGQKKGKNGKNYVFIKFKGVHDVKNLKRRLKGNKMKGMILEVNLAKYRRKGPTYAELKTHIQRPPPPP